MKRYIRVKREDREFIAKAFDITEKSVFNALTYDAKRGNTDLAKRVRKLAMERGGIIMVDAPELETIHDAGGIMKQRFANGAELIVNKETGSVTLWEKGMLTPTKTWDNPTIKRFERIQRLVAQLRSVSDSEGVVED